MTIQMGGSGVGWQPSARWLARLEPITPVFLAAHGAMLLRDSESELLEWILVLAAALLGVAGLAGWRSRSAVQIRAWLLFGLSWVLLYVTAGIASFFTLWLFMLAAVYPLVLRGWTSAVYPVVMAGAYLLLAPISDRQLLPAVLWGRAAVITAIGLVVAGISAAQRRTARDVALAKDQFVASVSHELRTPLTAVVGFAAELQQRAETLQPAEIEEFADTVYRHSVEVADIVEDLLVAAQADVGSVHVHPVVLDLRIELDNVVDEVFPLFNLPRTALAVSGSSALATADPIRVRQILRNLMVNALRYGGTQINAQLITTGEQTSIEIADDGSGIPDAHIARLFTPYQRFHETGSQPESIGLGLAVSRTLAQLMDGELSYTRRDSWSVFRLDLPAGPSVPQIP